MGYIPLRFVPAIMAIILLLPIGVYVWPLVRPLESQDRCDFGPVSNAQYRLALAEVRRLQTQEWPSLLPSGKSQFDQERLSKELARRVDIIEATLPQSIFGRIAAVHAVMRGAGAEYLTTMAENRDSALPFEEARSVAIVGYRLDMNRLGYFRPIRRWISVGVGFRIADGYQILTISAHIPSLLYFHEYARSKYHAICPAIPSTSLAPA